MRNIVAALVVVLLSAAASGQTISSVSADSISHGVSITISGSSFGSKSPAAPILFEDFDHVGVSPGDHISENSDWHEFGFNTGSENFHPMYSSVGRTGTNGYSYYWMYPDSVGGAQGSAYLGYTWPESRRVDYSERAFMSVQIMTDFPGAGDVGTCPDNIRPQQWKMGFPFAHWTAPGTGPDGDTLTSSWYPLVSWHWFGKGASCSCDYPGAMQIFFVHSEGSSTVGSRDFAEGCAAAPGIPGQPYNPEPYTWFQIETAGQASSGVDEADGIVEVWHKAFYKIHDAVTMNITGRTRTFTWGSTCLGRWIGQYASGGFEPHYAWFDDVYIDNTWARVALGNASTWDNCTTREYQPPTAWSATSITVTGNTGGFSNAAIAWLYVVDSDGNVSPGYSVTIGGEAASSSPGKPTVTPGSGNVAVSWTAASPAPANYQIEIKADDGVRFACVQVDGSNTSVTIPLTNTAASANLRTIVKAIDADGNDQSTSEETYTAGS